MFALFLLPVCVFFFARNDAKCRLYVVVVEPGRPCVAHRSALGFSAGTDGETRWSAAMIGGGLVVSPKRRYGATSDPLALLHFFFVIIYSPGIPGTCRVSE